MAPNNKIAFLSEELCIGCGICVKKCPFEAIMIINLPKNLEKETSHRYGPNSFKLHRMPLPRPGQVRRQSLSGEMQSWAAKRAMRDSLRVCRVAVGCEPLYLTFASVAWFREFPRETLCSPL